VTMTKEWTGPGQIGTCPLCHTQALSKLIDSPSFSNARF